MVEGPRPGLILPDAAQAGDRCNKALSSTKRVSPNYMKNLTWILSIAFAFVLLVPAVASAAPNTLTLTDKSGSAQTNYPLQFGRPFLQGEIRNYPQIKINGVAVQTQADIKNRYPDGSVKFAIISVMIPSIPANGSVTLSFQNQRSGNNPPLTAAQMLDAAYNFDAKMTLAFTSGQTRTVSARTMLQNGDHKPWTSGPIAQTIELADDTTARKYDQGNGDGYKPFRPRFYVTFWPVTRQVTVRYVGENGLTTELEDLTYNLTLTLGNTNPQNIYSADLTGTKKHWAMTNWTKTFWINGTPQKMVDINYNLAYLRETRFFPNYDTNLTIDPAAITSTYTSWTSRAKDLYDAGFWQKYMGSTGGRPDIAPYPRWSALWLYTGDWRLREISLSQADLAGAWTMNLRENNPTKILSRDDAPGSGTGLGRTVSVAGRPTFFSVRLTQTGTRVEDRVTIVGPLNVGSSWAWDGAHQPSPFYPQYILTGDPYYLALMYNWAGFSAASYNPGNSRGPSGAGGAIVDQLRGAGWVMRNRVETAFIAPDAHPEKHYFTYMTKPI